jgi:hypothetical protein
MVVVVHASFKNDQAYFQTDRTRAHKRTQTRVFITPPCGRKDVEGSLASFARIRAWGLALRCSKLLREHRKQTNARACAETPETHTETRACTTTIAFMCANRINQWKVNVFRFRAQ